MPEATQTAPSERITFWTQPATQWDVFKFFLPLVLACAFWAVRVEVNQARNESRFDNINDTLKAVQSGIKELNETKDERGQRLARIEAKLDVFITQKGSR